jgi:hypothetical protein
MVIRIRPGTMSRKRPIVMAMPARIDAAVRRGRGHGLADGHVGAAVPDVLHRLDQGGLEQEGRDHAHHGAEQLAHVSGQPEEPGDHRGHEVYDKRDGEQVPSEPLVHLPRLAQNARQWIHARIVTPKAQLPGGAASGECTMLICAQEIMRWNAGCGPPVPPQRKAAMDHHCRYA